MKATETRLLELLKGPKQFLIPIYQRSYSWTPKHCARLWDDVVRVASAKHDGAHFLGSIVYVEDGLYQATSLPQLLVIDGQQRLTTITLLLDALGDVLAEGEAGGVDAGEISARKIRNYFLRNAEECGELSYKLILSHGDAETLKRLVDDDPLPDDASEHLVENHTFFCDKLKASEVSPLDIYRGISRLLVVDIALDRTHDNPQLIFESLNSTGLDLSQGDLIRNFVLMGLEPERQTKLYQAWWREMELRLDVDHEPTGRGDPFDRFMRAWLTIVLERVPNLEHVYEAFQHFRRQHQEREIEDVLAELHRYSALWARMVLGQEKDPVLARRFAGLRGLRMDVQWPFLMKRLDAVEQGALTLEDFLRVLDLVESWMFRRAVCGMSSNVLSRAFPVLEKELDPADVVRSLARALAARIGSQRMPDDDTFRQSLMSRDTYGFRLGRHLLRRLEQHGQKEPVGFADLSIEHVIPQNEDLVPEWRQALGADWRSVRERWLHTLGNLTWTGYNPELSDRPFVEKRDMEGGFAGSPLRLNKSLARLEQFGEAELQVRAAALADLALEIWPGHGVGEEEVSELRTERRRRLSKRPPRSLDDIPRLQGPVRELYDALAVALRAQCPGLVEKANKHYVAWGRAERPKPYLLHVFPQRERFIARVRFPFMEIADPQPCHEMSRYSDGTAHTRIVVSDPARIADVVALVARAEQR